MDSSKPLTKNHPIQEIDTKTDTRSWVLPTSEDVPDKNSEDGIIARYLGWIGVNYQQYLLILSQYHDFEKQNPLLFRVDRPHTW